MSDRLLARLRFAFSKSSLGLTFVAAIFSWAPNAAAQGGTITNTVQPQVVPLIDPTLQPQAIIDPNSTISIPSDLSTALPNVTPAAATSAGAAACVPNPSMDPGLLTTVESALAALNAPAISLHFPGIGITTQTIRGSVTGWISGDRAACGVKNLAAQKSCFEACSSPMGQALAAGSMITSGIGAIGGNATSSCTALGKGLELLQLGFTAYNAECGLAQSGCTGVCGKAAASGAALKAQIAAQLSQPTVCLPGLVFGATPEAPAAIAACKAAALKATTEISAAIAADLAPSEGSVSGTVGAKNAQCTIEFKAKLAQGIASSAAIVKSMLAASQCKKATAAVALALDCSSAANAQNQTCICQGNPRLPGCSNTLAKEASSLASFGASSETAKPNATGSSSLSLPGEQAPTMPTQQSSTALGGGGGLSGGGGSPGGLAPPAADKAAAPSGGSRLNSSILGGDSGGGGGGGSNYGSRGSTSDEMRNYLPGGSRDPNRMISGGFALPKDVTGSGGRSNWEKVSERYKDAKSTLINQ